MSSVPTEVKEEENGLIAKEFSPELTVFPTTFPLDARWLMESIEVDGIRGRRPSELHSNLFFSLKSETDDFGNVRDAGAEMHWQPHIINESHWLSCKVVIPVGAACPVCGKRDGIK